MSSALRIRDWSYVLLPGCLGGAAGRTDKQAPSDTRTLQVAQGGAPVQQHGQSRRIALVVGNSNCASSPLTNLAHDAALIATTLTDLGFEVRLQKEAEYGLEPAALMLAIRGSEIMVAGVGFEPTTFGL